MKGGPLLLYPQAVVKQSAYVGHPEFAENDMKMTINSNLSWCYYGKDKIKKTQFDLECIWLIN